MFPLAVFTSYLTSSSVQGTTHTHVPIYAHHFFPVVFMARWESWPGQGKKVCSIYAYYDHMSVVDRRADKIWRVQHLMVA